MVLGNGVIVKIKSNDLSGKVIFNVFSPFNLEQININIISNGQTKKENIQVCGNTACFEIHIDEPKLWSITTPNLYTYDMELLGEGTKQAISGTFGIRSLGADKKNVLLNGLPVYVKGYIRGHKCHEHTNTCDLTEEEFYRKNIRQAKKYGFNFVRFHSTVPNETFFKVADEEGILVHIEMRDPDVEYNNQEEMITTHTEFVSDEFIIKVINSLYNHPSLAVYCIGNEIKWLDDYTRVENMGKLIKKEDDTRLYVDTCAWGLNNRKGVDIDVQHMSYYFPYGKHANMYENTENLLVCGSADGSATQSVGKNAVLSKELHFDMPLLAHEVCHYVALNDYKKLKEKFNKYGTEEPWWVDEEIKMINAKGLDDIYEKMYKSSKYFQLQCWKNAFEKMRLSKLLGGYHCLQFADTNAYENSNGVVDCFDEENYTTARDFMAFNDDAVVLADLEDRIYLSKGELSIPFYFSNFSETVGDFADFEFSLIGDSGSVYANCKLENVATARKGLYLLCTARVTLPNLLAPEKCVLKASLSNGKTLINENQWNVWLFTEDYAGTYNEFCSFEDDKIVITDSIEKALTSLKSGKNTCLIYRADWTRHVRDKKMSNPKYAFKASWNRFKPVIWDRGTNCGGLCDAKLLNKYGFASGEFYDYNYSVLTEDCDKINLDDFPVKVRSIISGNDKCVRDRFDATVEYFNLPELQYDRTLRNFSYMFEVKVEKSNLLVVGLNMTGLDQREPSTVAMAGFIKKYLNSKDFTPTNSISEKEFTAYLLENAKEPVRERIMTQFWALDDTPVESPEFWKESLEYLK